MVHSTNLFQSSILLLLVHVLVTNVVHNILYFILKVFVMQNYKLVNHSSETLCIPAVTRLWASFRPLL